MNACRRCGRVPVLHETLSPASYTLQYTTYRVKCACGLEGAGTITSKEEAVNFWDRMVDNGMFLPAYVPLEKRT